MILTKIRNNSIKKILSELSKYAKKDKVKYAEFIDQFGIPLKEGLYQDRDHRDELLELVRYKSSTETGYISLAEYTSRMKKDQKSIFYITGSNEDNLKNSPLLEMYKEKDIEVLIMEQEIDEFVIPSINKYKDYDLKSVNYSDAADELKSEEEKAKDGDIKPLIKKITQSLVFFTRIELGASK